MSSVSYLSFVCLCTHASDGESELQKEKKVGQRRSQLWTWLFSFVSSGAEILWSYSNSYCMSHLFSIESQTAQTAQSNCQQWQLTAFYIEAAYSLNAKVDMSSTMKAVLAYCFFYNIDENECFTNIMSFHLLFKYEGQAVFQLPVSVASSSLPANKIFLHLWRKLRKHEVLSCCHRILLWEGLSPFRAVEGHSFSVIHAFPKYPVKKQGNIFLSYIKTGSQKESQWKIWFKSRITLLFINSAHCY